MTPPEVFIIALFAAAVYRLLIVVVVVLEPLVAYWMGQ